MDNVLTKRVSPVHISFPLLRAPRLSVSAWRRFVPGSEAGPLNIEVTNTGDTPVRIAGVFVGYMHTFLPAELLKGRRTARIPLGDLAGNDPPPRILGGGSVRWTADLNQVRDLLMREQMRSPRLRRMYAIPPDPMLPRIDRFYADRAEIESEMDREPRGLLALKVDNLARRLTHRRLAVVVEYGERRGEGRLFKAKARWEAPSQARGAAHVKSRTQISAAPEYRIESETRFQ